jgi:hypothetical protein
MLELEYEMIEKYEDCFCKCGIEQRHWVPSLYGAYFYTQSKQGGLERYEQVRKEVDRKIGTDISVILKRACTEFELKDVDSSKWHKSKWALHMEKLFFENSNVGKQAQKQPDILKVHVMRKWIQFAFENADATAVLYNNNQPLYTPSVTYHTEKIENAEIQRSLQKADVLAK